MSSPLRSTLFPWLAHRACHFTDALFVCNSHVGMAMKEAMTRAGRRDGR